MEPDLQRARPAEQSSGGGDGQQAGGRGGDFNNGSIGNGINGGAWGGANWGGGWGGGWDYRNWRLTEEDVRQLRGEVRQYTGDLQALRRDLAAENIDPRDLDEILRALRQLDDPRVYQNVQELARLQSTIAEGLKRFEFGLRRQSEAANTIVLSGSDEVPEEFRKLVQEYYRSLGRTGR